MAKLKPWYHVVTPREDLRENRAMDASEFAVHLDHIRQGRAHDDYKKPERFFDRTFMTKALLELCSQTVRRLSGIKVETSAVFNMATQFGGGKTHALTALYHLANGGDTAKAWKGVEAVLKKAGVSTVPKAKVAVFVGTEFDPLTGRGGDGEPVRKTPWGDIAWQLGGEEAFRAVAEHDKKGIAPGGDVIRQMLPDGPTLILMDELLNYLSRGRKLAVREGLYSFLQNLSEEARARDGLVLCVSLPASIATEMTPEDEDDFERFKHMLNRLGKAIMMSAETEIAEIIRRRLFEWYGLPEEGRKAATEYADWAVEHAAELAGVDASNARELFMASYPFHPAVLSVFERKWQSLRRFQRTRGILRLLALWVQHAYQEEHRRAGGRGEALITLGSAPIEDPTFRAAMFEQLGSSDLEGPVTTDIAGKSDAWSIRLDREAAEAIKKERLHQKVATSILFESNGGQTKKLYATVPEIRAAVGSPDVNMTDVEHVLEQLASSCYYLSQEGNRYKFSLTPNLNKILTDRRASVAPLAIDQRVKKEIESLFKPGPKGSDVERKYWPQKTNEVPDRPELTLVVLGAETPAGAKPTQALMEQIVRECGTSGRTMKSAIIFVVPESPASIVAATRDVLAWEDIEDDEETKKRLDESQKKQLAIGVGRAKADLKEAIWRAYRHLHLLDKSNALKEIDLGQITSSMAGSLVELIINRLVKDDEISDGIHANRLLKFWPPALDKWSTKGVRDAFYSSPALQRLLKAEAVKRTIADGVTQGLLGYARDNGRGGVTLEKFREALAEADVEIADDVFILKAEDARKLLEPPRLALLKVTPANVSVRVGEKATFTAEGIDQYGQAFVVGSVTWGATGGVVDGAGVFKAGDEAGVFVVKARAGGIEGSAQIRITTVTEPAGPGTGAGGAGPGGGRGLAAGKVVLRWSGTIPPQKWMNFYTRVVSKHVSNPELKLTVSFEVPVGPTDASNCEQEMRSSLRELGLADETQVG
jgi:hypothetical protein